MAKRFVTLVRHGQRETGVGSDIRNPRLTELGWKQAHQLARRLASVEVDVIHTSSLCRAMETAQILAIEHPGIPIRPSRLLWECVPIVPGFVVAWFKEHGQFITGPLPAEIQPWQDIWSQIEDEAQLASGLEQAKQAWEKYFTPARGKDRNDIIVCHGNLIRYFVLRALNVSPETWINMEIYNCSMCEIAIDSSNCPSLISYNDSGHLLAGQVTLF